MIVFKRIIRFNLNYPTAFDGPAGGKVFCANVIKRFIA
jgi:hypothetical protein